MKEINWKKELRQRIIAQEKQTDKEMKEWWERILPRRGSLLRQLLEDK